MGIDYGGIRIGRTALEVEMYESGSDGRPLSWVDYHGWIIMGVRTGLALKEYIYLSWVSDEVSELTWKS